MQGDTRCGHRPAGVQGRHPRDVHRVVARAGAGAHDDVLDVGRIETHPVLQRVQHLREDPLGMNVGQTADAGLTAAAGRTHPIDDPGFSHGNLQLGTNNATHNRPKPEIDTMGVQIDRRRASW